MGLSLVFIAVILIVTFLNVMFTTKFHERLNNAIIAAVVTTAIFSVISIIIVSKSYQTYIWLEQKRAVIEQYREAITLYAEKGIQEFDTGGASEITDLKYNNYQTQIGQMIRELRDTIVVYNKGVTGKKIMNDSFMFNWYIWLPQDMKIIKMSV